MTGTAAAVAAGSAGPVLLVAPHGSYRTAPFLGAAATLGIRLLVASEGRYSPVGVRWEGVHVDLDQPEAAVDLLLQVARRAGVVGVLGSDDSTTELAARVAGALGLRHNPPGAVLTARRKDFARACLAEAGLPVPEHRVVDLRRPLGPQVDGVRFPCVVKPVALSASRGVIRADDVDDLLRALARVGSMLREVAHPEERSRVLVEDFIPGFEVAVEGLLMAGELSLLAIFDKPDPLDGPFFEETYYVTPSRLSLSLQENIRRRVAEACRAYGLVEGPVHAECRINHRGVWILEVAARTIGGLCGRLLRFGTGYGLEDLVLAHAVGQRIRPEPERGAAGALMIPVPRAGILRRVEGLQAARQVSFVEEIAIQVREGYELVPWPEGSSYLGFIFARAPRPEQAEAALRRAHACLDVVVAPLWKAVLGVGAGQRAVPVSA
jgi:biotin carboxylase